ncbi:hypothetical protein MMC32_002442 [Xylographa parallela]|nr:hypothetical protein [Xylographa parallela]
MAPSLPTSRRASPPSRFTPQNSTAEDLLKTQTVGLVHLSEFRKRRAEALEQKEREATGSSLGRFTPGGRSGAATPSHGASTPPLLPAKKKRKNPAKGKLSFGVDDEDQDHSSQPSKATTRKPSSPDAESLGQSSPPPSSASISKRRLGPNTTLPLAPKALTKSALLRDAQTRESLRKEFLVLQESIKATEIVIPFVFYDGTNIPGGMCKVKMGDHIWVFLDLSRKVGAELGVGGSGGEKASVRREWARVGVDDLMLVRGEIILPHVSTPWMKYAKRGPDSKQHYDFYYFIINKTLGPSSTPLFDYSAQPSRSATASPVPAERSSYEPLPVPAKKNNGVVTSAASRLEGYSDDPNLTKVVDRRWYERNKHIFPASVWEEFDPTKDYTRGMRRDAEGNAFFFT